MISRVRLISTIRCLDLAWDPTTGILLAPSFSHTCLLPLSLCLSLWHVPEHSFSLASTQSWRTGANLSNQAAMDSRRDKDISRIRCRELSQPRESWKTLVKRWKWVALSAGVFVSVSSSKHPRQRRGKRCKRSEYASGLRPVFVYSSSAVISGSSDRLIWPLMVHKWD